MLNLPAAAGPFSVTTRPEHQYSVPSLLRVVSNAKDHYQLGR